MPDDRLTKSVLNFDLRHGTNTGTNELKGIFDTIGYVFNVDEMTPCDLRSDLIDRYNSRCIFDQLSNSIKLRTYRMYKISNDEEKYLSYYMVRHG